ncbi:MAG: flavodoxin-dependent (E)-4-hydroxy-3-methylbut-2-enyl-diphosphate synthase [Planctomycetes bacterium]|nr:flavodoxin-dependent (E)-4-hydroxy-3-methylbut-2-enyl-diphosphate synthase [Planctomycetota bacterium]
MSSPRAGGPCIRGGVAPPAGFARRAAPSSCGGEPVSDAIHDGLERLPARRPTRQVTIGAVTVGGDAPIRVQSMCSTDTRDRKATLAQIRRMEEAGCEMVRVAVPDREAVAVLPELKRQMQGPLIADIHFNHRLAVAALEAGADKVRINPGNIGGPDRVREVVRAARDHGAALRIGVNSGSLEQDLLERHGHPSAAALAESAARHIAFVRELGFDNVVCSIKSTRVRTSLAAHLLLADQVDVPLHIGITEAGLPPYGTIKSAAGLGALLLHGIGDTIRVSLTADPVEEVAVAYALLKALELRVTSPEVLACPTCGRIAIDLEKVVREVEHRIQDIRAPLRIAILGCAVNGPGEAREADVGIAGGKGSGLLFRRGELLRRVPEAELVDALEQEVRKLAAERP